MSVPLEGHVIILEGLMYTGDYQVKNSTILHSFQIDNRTILWVGWDLRTNKVVLETEKLSES